MTELGHVVLYVRDLATARRFYEQAVGLEVVGELFNGRAVMFSGGRTHHELMLIEVGEAPGPLQGRRLGLYHVAWKVGDSIDALRAARDRVSAAGYSIDAMLDHTVSQSLYLHDPDGNEVELYVDDPAVDWQRSKEWLEEPVRPLVL